VLFYELYLQPPFLIFFFFNLNKLGLEILILIKYMKTPTFNSVFHNNWMLSQGQDKARMSAFSTSAL
jgi:hypothetical protein